MIDIEVTNGICTGRNGTMDIKAVSITTFGDKVRLDGVSKARGKILNAGLSMDKDAAKRLAEGILLALKPKGQ